MATFTATKAINGNSTYYSADAGDVLTAYSKYSITAALVINDVIQMLRLPAGARVIGTTLKTADLDTNGSPTITLDVGDTGDVDRLIAAATVGQAGGASTSLVSSTGQFYQYTTETVISVLVKAAPATGATSGDIELAVQYVMQ